MYLFGENVYICLTINLKTDIMQDLVIIFEAASKLGFDLDGLTVNEGIALKNEIKDCIEQAIINSDNK